MSDTQQGPEWWQASDGKWYPPEQATVAEQWAPAVPPGGSPESPKQGMSSGGKVGLAVAVVAGALLLLVGGIALLGGDDDGDPEVASTTTEEDTSDTTDDTSATTDTAGVPDGLATLEGDGVSIAAPEGWQIIDAEDLNLGGEEFSAAFPDAPPGLVDQGLTLFQNGAVLVAFDFGGVTFADNVNVVDIPQEAPLEEIEGQASQQLTSLGGEVLDSGIVDVAPGKALRIEYTLAVTLPDGTSMPAEGVQYYVPLDGHTYIVTVTTTTGAAALGDQMIETFSVG